MKYGELEIGTKLQSCMSERVGVLTAKSDNYVMVEWPMSSFNQVETYKVDTMCNMKILPKDPVTFGELEVGDVVGYATGDELIEETAVYRNSKVVVLDTEDDDLTYLYVDEVLANAGRVFIRRGAK